MSNNSSLFKSVESTCMACPSQWEGETVEGKKFYARFRYGRLWYGEGETVDEACRNDVVIYDNGDEYDGCMCDDTMIELVEEWKKNGSEPLVEDPQAEKDEEFVRWLEGFGFVVED